MPVSIDAEVQADAALRERLAPDAHDDLAARR